MCYIGKKFNLFLIYFITIETDAGNIKKHNLHAKGFSFFEKFITRFPQR